MCRYCDWIHIQFCVGIDTHAMAVNSWNWGINTSSDYDCRNCPARCVVKCWWALGTVRGDATCAASYQPLSSVVVIVRRRKKRGCGWHWHRHHHHKQVPGRHMGRGVEGVWRRLGGGRRSEDLRCALLRGEVQGQQHGDWRTFIRGPLFPGTEVKVSQVYGSSSGRPKTALDLLTSVDRLIIPLLLLIVS